MHNYGIVGLEVERASFAEVEGLAQVANVAFLLSVFLANDNHAFAIGKLGEATCFHDGFEDGERAFQGDFPGVEDFARDVDGRGRGIEGNENPWVSEVGAILDFEFLLEGSQSLSCGGNVTDDGEVDGAIGEDLLGEVEVGRAWEVDLNEVAL